MWHWCSWQASQADTPIDQDERECWQVATGRGRILSNLTSVPAFSAYSARCAGEIRAARLCTGGRDAARRRGGFRVDLRRRAARPSGFRGKRGSAPRCVRCGIGPARAFAGWLLPRTRALRQPHGHSTGAFLRMLRRRGRQPALAAAQPSAASAPVAECLRIFEKRREFAPYDNRTVRSEWRTRWSFIERTVPHVN